MLGWKFIPDFQHKNLAHPPSVVVLKHELFLCHRPGEGRGESCSRSPQIILDGNYRTTEQTTSWARTDNYLRSRFSYPPMFLWLRVCAPVVPGFYTWRLLLSRLDKGVCASQCCSFWSKRRCRWSVFVVHHFDCCVFDRVCLTSAFCYKFFTLLCSNRGIQLAVSAFFPPTPHPAPPTATKLTQTHATPILLNCALQRAHEFPPRGAVVCEDACFDQMHRNELPGPDSAGVPNLSFTMYPFSNPTDEHVPLQQSNRWACTPSEFWQMNIYRYNFLRQNTVMI